MTVDWLAGMFREGFIALGSLCRRSNVMLRPLSSFSLLGSILELHSHAVKMERGKGFDSVPYSGGFFLFIL